MNNYIFTDKNGKQYKRVNKTTARRLYDAGNNIILAGSNINPFNIYGVCRAEININDYLKYGYTSPAVYSDGTRDNDFKYRVNSFEFYNIRNAETGYYTAFYVAI